MAAIQEHRRPSCGRRRPDEMSALLLDLKREQFNLRFQRATGPERGGPRAVRQVRREIARVKTLQHQSKPTAS